MKSFIADSHCRTLALSALFMLGATVAAHAALPDAPAPQSASQPATVGSTAPVPAHQSDIGDILFPDRFTVDPGVETQPMSFGQKFGAYGREQIGLTTPIATALTAAYSQALDSDPKYGQGWGPYGQRFGALFIESESTAFFRGVFFPTLLHQDPRYYRKGTGGFWARTVYAATRVLITRQDSGRRAINVSALAASGGAAALTLAYYPDQSQTTSSVLYSFAGNVGGIAGANWLREFGPEIKHKVFHRE